MCLLMHTTPDAHKQIILPTFPVLYLHIGMCLRRGLFLLRHKLGSIGAAAGQKQTYLSIPVYDFLIFFLLFQKEEPSNSFLKTCQCTEAGKGKSGSVASVCKVLLHTEQHNRLPLFFPRFFLPIDNNDDNGDKVGGGGAVPVMRMVNLASLSTTTDIGCFWSLSLIFHSMQSIYLYLGREVEFLRITSQ
jgi:hypothetical protein